MKPLLQLALDETSLERAEQIIATGVQAEVDVIEAGTLLLAAEGQRAVRRLRALCPNKTIVADFKLADAGQTLAALLLDAGADYATVICAADPKTMALAQATAAARGKEMQIELYGHWTMEQARQWRQLGMGQIIYHHPRDGGKPWGQQDVEAVAALCDMGYRVSVTGGLTAQTPQLFKGLPVFAFIAGRALLQGDPVTEARRFQAVLRSCWPEE